METTRGKIYRVLAPGCELKYQRFTNHGGWDYDRHPLRVGELVECLGTTWGLGSDPAMALWFRRPADPSWERAQFWPFVGSIWTPEIPDGALEEVTK